MRISGGIARGIPLRAPKGVDIRPATDRLRQSVFSSLAAHVTGARFLDLYAGTGAYGLEALSRGAVGGTFVERDARTAECLRANIAAVCKSLGRDEKGVAVVQADARSAPFDGAVPDLVFVDPPYEDIDAIAGPLFGRLSKALGAAAETLVIFEMPGERTLSPPGWREIRRLGKGARQPTAAIFKTIPASP